MKITYKILEKVAIIYSDKGTVMWYGIITAITNINDSSRFHQYTVWCEKYFDNELRKIDDDELNLFAL